VHGLSVRQRRSARCAENNLKNISLDIPRRQITVFTGVSGSGKSSLVFDTIAAESQRLINETFSTGAAGRGRAVQSLDGDHRRPAVPRRKSALHARCFRSGFGRGKSVPNEDAFDTVENLQGGQAQKVVESGGYNTSELNTLHAGPSL
jgi:hypothetical protein